jgi:hypothetical protein
VIVQKNIKIAILKPTSLYCNAYKKQQCPQNSHPPIFGKYLKGFSLHFPLVCRFTVHARNRTSNFSLQQNMKGLCWQQKGNFLSMAEHIKSQLTAKHRRWLRYSTDSDERGLHVWHGWAGGGASQPETGAGQSSMGGREGGTQCALKNNTPSSSQSITPTSPVLFLEC